LVASVSKCWSEGKRARERRRTDPALLVPDGGVREVGRADVEAAGRGSIWSQLCPSKRAAEGDAPLGALDKVWKGREVGLHLVCGQSESAWAQQGGERE